MTARLIAAVVLLASVGIAQTRPAGPSPSDLYHQGAKLFVDGDDEPALAAVERGLARAPGDARLQALKDLILQSQEDEPQDENQDPQDGDGEQNQDQGGEQDPQDQEPEGDGDDQRGQRPPEAERDGTAQQPPQNPGQPQPPQGAGKPDEMTAAQAQRLLDAVGGEERLLLREMQRSTGQHRRSDKDW